MGYGECKNCGAIGYIESHHIVSRKQQPALIACKLNIKDLCLDCHRGTKGMHGKHPEDIQKRIKLGFQDYLNELFVKDILTIDEISKRLEINEKNTIKLVKLLYPVNGNEYKKEDVIRACMGGKFVL